MKYLRIFCREFDKAFSAEMQRLRYWVWGLLMLLLVLYYIK